MMTTKPDLSKAHHSFQARRWPWPGCIAAHEQLIVLAQCSSDCLDLAWSPGQHWFCACGMHGIYMAGIAYYKFCLYICLVIGMGILTFLHACLS